jgi:L-amino acid N-acyltransferase YncA
VVRREVPVVVVEGGLGDVIALASTSEYRRRECYAGVPEFSVVARSARRLGAGRLCGTWRDTVIVERLISD